MGIGDFQVDRHDDASSRARETKWRPSGIRPEETWYFAPLSAGPPLKRVSQGRNIYHANVPIHCCYSLVCSGLKQFTRYNFFDGKDDAIFTSDPYRCAAVFNCFYSVFDLGFSYQPRLLEGRDQDSFQSYEAFIDAIYNSLGSSCHQGKRRNSKDRSLFLWMSVQAQSACNFYSCVGEY